jgi:3-oxoadipate enol-lactonase
MPSLTVDSAEIYYQETGTGYPLVLLHGLGSSSADWMFQTPVLSGHFRLIAINLRGHAPSSLVRGPVTIHALAADVAQLLEALEIRQAHVLGCRWVDWWARCWRSILRRR